MFTRQWFTVDAGIHSVEAGPVRLAEAAAMSLSARGLLALILATAWVVTAITPAGASPAPALGTNDSTYGTVAAVSPADVWAADNFLPDTPDSNQDATLATAAHFDGSTWTQTPVPDSGPNFNTLFGVAATPGRAWAVGVALDSSYQAHSLVESWDGGAWHITATPKLGTQRDILYSAAAVSASNMWAVGERQSENGMYATLIEHWDGKSWSVVPSPNPGASGNHLYGVAAAGPSDIWAVGQRDGLSSDIPLAEHWDGRRWTVTDVPSAGLTGGLLQGVTVTGGEVWAVGQSDDAAHQACPLIEHLSDGAWSAELPAGLGTAFSNLTGVAVADGTAWAVGSAFDAASGNQLTLVARHTRGGWKQVAAPNPGTGDRVLGGISSAGAAVWAAGFFETDVARSPLIELHK
jgi:hypothetical protein